MDVRMGTDEEKELILTKYPFPFIPTKYIFFAEKQMASLVFTAMPLPAAQLPIRHPPLQILGSHAP